MTTFPYAPDLAERVARHCHEIYRTRLGTGQDPWEELAESQRISLIWQAELWLNALEEATLEAQPQATDPVPQPKKRIKKGTSNG